MGRNAGCPGAGDPVLHGYHDLHYLRARNVMKHYHLSFAPFPSGTSIIPTHSIGREKTYLARILQDSHENSNLARFWQKRQQILQEFHRKVISCKNLARFLKDLLHQENFFVRFTSLCRQIPSISRTSIHFLQESVRFYFKGHGRQCITLSGIFEEND